MIIDDDDDCNEDDDNDDDDDDDYDDNECIDGNDNRPLLSSSLVIKIVCGIQRKPVSQSPSSVHESPSFTP